MVCGDAYPNKSAGEECDDGNVKSGDGCQSDCKAGKDAQLLALDALKAASTIPVEVWFEDGIPTSIHMQVPLGGAAADPVAGALAFLDLYRDLYKIDDPVAGLFVDRMQIDRELTSITFGQRVGQVPLLGGEIVVLIDPAGEVTGTSGRWYKSVPKTVETPALQAEEAEALALADKKILTTAQIQAPTKLVYYDEGLLAGTPTKARLCWRVALRGVRTDKMEATVDLYVDAFSGDVLASADREETARDFDLSSAQSDTSSTCWGNFFDDPSVQWFTENGPTSDYPGGRRRYPGGDLDGDNMYQHTVATYDFWLSNYGRRGSDGSDEQVEAFCHVGSGWTNASANDWCMQFGDGMLTPDIYGHEYTHSVIKDAADFTYRFQSGAVSESFADFFGVAASHYSNWLIGEGSAAPNQCTGGAAGTLRDMSNPLRCSQPDHFSNFQMLPASDDNGGVHTNSGILNKAFFLMADGGTHRGIPVIALGRGLTAYYLYKTLTQRLVSSSQLIDVRNQVVNAMRGVGDPRPPALIAGVGPGSICMVSNAFAAVGLATAALDTDCDGTLDTAETDSDGDSIPDSRDNCPSIPSTDQDDLDGDGSGDLCDLDDDNDAFCNFGGPVSAGSPGVAVQCNIGNGGRDNCPRLFSSTQNDFDNDGVGDACEDSDGDGTLDQTDNCPADPTSVRSDIDSDTVGDACDLDADNDMICNTGGPLPITEADGVMRPCFAAPFGFDTCPNVQNFNQGDSDGDSLLCTDGVASTNRNYGCADFCDNCPNSYNADQRDRDHDGLGDGCDDDRDGDGIANGSDNCPDRRNPDQADLDANGIGGACDTGERWQVFATDGTLALGSVAIDALRSPIEIPLPSCLPPDCGDWLSPLIERRFFFDFASPMRVQIVDEDGKTVARAQEGMETKLRFQPDPEWYYLPPGLLPVIGAASSRSGNPRGSAVEPYEGKSYTLQIYPGPDAIPGVSYPIGIGADQPLKCSAQPMESCKVTLKRGKSLLVIKDNGKEGRTLTWKISQGVDAALADFGDPTGSGSYALCLYDDTTDTPVLQMEALIPGGGRCEGDVDCWEEGKNGSGYKFSDGRRLFDGVSSILFKSGTGGKSSLAVKAGGGNLRLPTLPLGTPLRVQLQVAGGGCWQAAYTPASVQTNKPGSFTAYGD